MEQYILKSALVAEINRILSAFENSDAPVDRLRASTLIALLSFIDTLEVKEVDLEKEIRLYRMKNSIIGHREESLYDYMTNVAKHFFELGLKA